MPHVHAHLEKSYKKKGGETKKNNWRGKGEKEIKRE